MHQSTELTESPETEVSGVDENRISYDLIVKQDCPTCRLAEPAYSELYSRFGKQLQIYSQDDAGFPSTVPTRHDDSSLEFTFHNNIEIVPTLIRRIDGKESARIYGWDRQQWQDFTGIPTLGSALAAFRPGCGSKSLDSGAHERLQLKFGTNPLQSRELLVDEDDDVMEVCFERGWSDGLPVVPPTPLRVSTMLNATHRAGDEVLGLMPPDRVPCTVEKVAINAVLAGCKPEYFPTVLAAVEAALIDAFCMHGLLCTTYFSSPVVIVNGPVARMIGMNGGINALGQGNRANATIGRALQLVIRNVGGGKPGGIDRATLGNPGKYTFCFSEDESEPGWNSLAMDHGYARGDSVLSLFAGDGVQPVADQRSRTPESLAQGIALSLRSICHSKLYLTSDALLILCQEHRRIFMEAGWSKANIKEALFDALRTPGADLMRGAGGMAEGMPESMRDKVLNKFRDNGLHILCAGGRAGFFSAIISGWAASGERGSQLVSQQVVS